MRASPFVEWGARLFEQMAQEGRDFKRQRSEYEEQIRLHGAKQQQLLALPHCPPAQPSCTPRAWNILYDVGVGMHQGSRPYQEDRYALLTSERLHMVAVYDGHGGSVTSATLQHCLLTVLRDALEPILERGGSIRAVCTSIHDTFMEVNTSLCTGNQNVVSDGSTAAVLVICKVQGRLLAISANAGDSRITLGLTLKDDGSAPASRPLPSTSSSNDSISAVCDSGLRSTSSSSQMDSETAADGCCDSGWGGDSSSGEDSPTLLSPSATGRSAMTAAAAPPVVAKRLSRDHDLKTNYEEIERIRAAGGVLMRFQPNGPLRVISAIGGLNMSRSFGDVAYHGLVIAKPFISVTALTDSVKFIIVATDGLWTVMGDEEAVACANFALDSSNAAGAAPEPVGALAGAGQESAHDGSAQRAADHLLHEAGQRWNRRFMGHQDNTTVAVLRFKWPSLVQPAAASPVGKASAAAAAVPG